MTVPTIIRRSLLAGTQGVSGPTVVIDTFRAFTTAAFLLNRSVDRIVLTETLDEARRRSRSIPDSILCGEEGGRRPDDFDLGNSPIDVEAYGESEGGVVVMRTSSGTRSVVSALRSGADPVYAASLVVAGATVSALRGELRVTIVASGLGGVTPADEDEETADLVASRLLERADDPGRVGRIRDGAGAERLRTTRWIDPEDLARCLDVDRFDFAMRAKLEDEVAVLRREESPRSPVPGRQP
ncbi:MAG: 2-phosphosulfolactate phosphatase [Actinomycetota bacterium]|nr:2-phosphosulfolactate phosphatase [Actinomycetota bacterium]